MTIQFSGYWRPQQVLAWLDRLPLPVVVATGVVLGCGVGGAGFYYLEAPGWAVAWLALFAALGWLGYTAAPIFDEPNPVQAAAKPAKPRPVRDGSLLMVDLPGGRFLMGSPDSDDLAANDEKPQHEVTVSPFRVAITPVTAELYREVMPESSTALSEPEARWPATNVSWFDAIEFCNRGQTTVWRGSGTVGNQEMGRLYFLYSAGTDGSLDHGRGGQRPATAGALSDERRDEGAVRGQQGLISHRVSARIALNWRQLALNRRKASRPYCL